MTYKTRCVRCHKLFQHNPPPRRPRKKGMCDACIQETNPPAWKKIQVKRFLAKYYPKKPQR